MNNHGECQSTRARLIVESGLASPRINEIQATKRIRLGRHRENEIILQDKRASRWHAELFYRDDRWFVVDKATTNGTRVDGQRIHDEVPLKDQQIVSIGEVRLRFSILSEAPSPSAETPSSEPLCVEATDDSTLDRDELNALFRFMNGTLGETTPDRLVRAALETILDQTGADLAGYLSLDSSPELRLVLPVKASVDQHLSKRMTQRVLQEGKRVWLGSPQEQSLESESLSNYFDALCLPLLMNLSGEGSELPLGALHVYQRSRAFTERQVRFCEVLTSNLAVALRLLRSRRALEADNSRLRDHSHSSGDELLGQSSAIERLRQQIRRLADGPATVLIAGESGVGKELVALGLHRLSIRSKGPLVTVNCAAINGSMAESELFGHVKGAFTGATRDHPGFFAQADMGTLFLDELGELSLDLQAKLLRAIETRCFRPIGATQDQRADVRILAATNRDLEREAREGKFRRDLFYRLTTRIFVPPLRDRLEDVPELVSYFLSRLNLEYHRNVSLSEAALERLNSYSWPGNVRQLRSVLEAAVAMANAGTTLQARDLYLPNEELLANDLPPSLNLELIEEWAIRKALEQTDGNNTQAARLLGIHRDTLISKQKKYGIDRKG